MLNKIQQDNDKAERVKLEKMALLEQRKQIQSQMRSEKEELMHKFEVIQKTGRIPPDLIDKIGKDRMESLNNTRQNNNHSLEMSPSPNVSIKKEQKAPKPLMPEKPKQKQQLIQPRKENDTITSDVNKKNDVIKQNDK